ncbi:Alanine--tRNA ligase [Phlyctochytrium bullatum]|nr:Alanine--tRNA ligase [Phlyctochytrium bullatum]
MSVIVYSSSVSGNLMVKKHTTRIIDILRGRRIEFMEVDVSVDEDAKHFMQSKSGKNVLPQIFSHGEYRDNRRSELILIEGPTVHSTQYSEEKGEIMQDWSPSVKKRKLFEYAQGFPPGRPVTRLHRIDGMGDSSPSMCLQKHHTSCVVSVLTRIRSMSVSSDIQWPVKRVRDTFVNFFVEKYGHQNVISSSTIPYEDPTLLFANSGMNQKEAIAMAWELLTEVYKLPKDRLYITYFGGDEALGLGPDLEAKQLWLDMGLSPVHVIPFGSKENFWEMGDQGPCGPCSEIHFDRIGGRDASHLVNMDDPDVVEIWNLVFMQFNREPDRSLRSLPNKHIDTGMGLERITSALQDKRSNYDTDVFTPIFAKIQAITGARPYAGKLGDEDKDGVDTAYRVVADHVRTLTFAISDGGLPSNEGRGYGEAFPEIKKRVGELKEILDEEERSFAKTLDRGEKLFEGYVSKAQETGSKILSGADVWRLYDTYGFPVDLTRLMAEEIGFSIDEEAFLNEQAKAKNISRAGKSEKDRADVALDIHALGEIEKNSNIPKTNDSFKYTIYKAGSFHQKCAVADGNVGILLDETNFYAEQGGQIFDVGTLTIDEKAEFEVFDVQVYGGYVLHIGFLKYGELNLSDKVVASYDEVECLRNESDSHQLRRRPIRSNHTGTHILNFALQKVLGNGVDQKGSLVSPEKLRFDFSHKSQPTPEQVEEIEKICKEMIAKSLNVYAKEVPLDVAKSINGLRAVFGEVYPDPVRVVSVGFDVDEVMKNPSSVEWTTSSIEFCGGTHVENTADIRNFSILEESSIAKGIRRVIAVTGEEATKAQQTAAEFGKKVDSAQSLVGKELEAALKTLVKETDEIFVPLKDKLQFRKRVQDLKKAFDDADKAKKAKEAKDAIDEVKSIFDKDSGLQYIVRELKVGGNAKALSGAVAHAKSLGKSALLLSVDLESEKVHYHAVVAKEHIEKGLKAKAWADVISKALNGKSGGKDDSAQGAGARSNDTDEVLQLAAQFAKTYIS